MGVDSILLRLSSDKALARCRGSEGHISPALIGGSFPIVCLTVLYLFLVCVGGIRLIFLNEKLITLFVSVSEGFHNQGNIQFYNQLDIDFFLIDLQNHLIQAFA